MATVPDLTTQSKPAPAGNFDVWYAHFHDEPGYAILTPDRTVLFADHDAHFTLLTHADIPFTTLLGQVSLTERQNTLDALGAAWICTHRQMEVA